MANSSKVPIKGEIFTLMKSERQQDDSLVTTMTFLCKDEKQRAKLVIDSASRKKHPAYQICMDLAFGRILYGKQCRIDGAIVNTAYHIKKAGASDSFGLTTRVLVDKIKLLDGDVSSDDEFSRLPKTSYGGQSSAVSKVVGRDKVSEDVSSVCLSHAHEQALRTEIEISTLTNMFLLNSIPSMTLV